MIPPVPPLNPEENGDFLNRAAQGAAVEHDEAPIDPELAAVIAAWETLPVAVRRGILAMVEAAGQ